MRFENRFSANITVMVRAATAASKSLLRDFGELEKLQVSRKSLGDFVSTADLNAEKVIVEQLQKARPKFGFLLEEGGVIEGEDKQFRWIIDPLDGTTNFLHGIPHWSISIALEETVGNKSEIIAGVVYDAVKQELFWAEKGNGAHLNAQRLRVSGREQLNVSIIASGFPCVGNPDGQKLFLKESEIMMQQVAGIRRMGSAALDLCYVACGRLEGYWERGVKEWDIAAGELMVREAGGFVTDLDGKKEYLNKGEVLAGNYALHTSLLKLLKKAKD